MKAWMVWLGFYESRKPNGDPRPGAYVLVRAPDRSRAKMETVWGVLHRDYGWTSIRVRRVPALDGPERKIPYPLCLETGYCVDVSCSGCGGLVDRSLPHAIIEDERCWCSPVCHDFPHTRIDTPGQTLYHQKLAELPWPPPPRRRTVAPPVLHAVPR